MGMAFLEILTYKFGKKCEYNDTKVSHYLFSHLIKGVYLYPKRNLIHIGQQREYIIMNNGLQRNKNIILFRKKNGNLKRLPFYDFIKY